MEICIFHNLCHCTSSKFSAKAFILVSTNFVIDSSEFWRRNSVGGGGLANPFRLFANNDGEAFGGSGGGDSGICSSKLEY